uniref:Uncharacterized protein n=1 Tax=Glossina morsitans morsitans TaxID=37546 RepID=A0A1B0FLZ3_GLOMM
MRTKTSNMSSSLKIDTISSSNLNIPSVKNLKLFPTNCNEISLITVTSPYATTTLSATTTTPAEPMSQQQPLIHNYTADSCDLMSPPLSANAQEHFRTPLCNLKRIEGNSLTYNHFISAEAHFPDFSQLTFAASETPNFLFSESQTNLPTVISFLEDDERQSPGDDSIKSESMQIGQEPPSSYQCQKLNRADVFRFEPEHIARLTASCQFEENNTNATVSFMQQQQMPYTAQTTTTTTTATTATTATSSAEFVDSFNSGTQMQQPSAEDHTMIGTSDYLNLDIEYFNYDEINCQSKNQSPCSTPPLDPWMNINSSETLQQPSRQDSPKLINTSYDYHYHQQQTLDDIKHANHLKTKLPSMMSTFGTPKYEPLSSFAASSDMSQSSLYHHHQNQTHQQHEEQSCPHVFNQRGSASLTYQYEQNFLTTPSYAEELDNCNLLNMDKPNRDHKIIWTIDELDEINEELINETARLTPKSINFDPVSYLCDNDNNVSHTDEDEENGNDYLQKAKKIDNDSEDNDDVFITTKPKTIKTKRRRFDSQSSVTSASSVGLIGVSSSCSISTKDANGALLPPMICRWSECYEEFPNQKDFKTVDPNNATKTRRHSESSIVQGQTAMNINDLTRKLKQNTYKPRSNSCSETTNFPSSTVLLNNTYENEQKLLNVLTDSQTNTNTKAKALSSALPALSLPPSPAGVVSINRNSMNFNELSNCIVTIEHKQYQNCNESGNNNGCDNNRITIIDTNCRSNGNEHESINQLNEFQQLMQVTVNNQTNLINNIKMTTTAANGQLTTASVESLNCKNKYTMSATNTTTNSISNKYRNNHFTTNTATIATTTTANKVNATTTTTTTTCAGTNTSNTLSNLSNDNNNAHEFVSFEYVKKLLSETFDYMDEDGGDDDNDDENNILMKSMTTNDSVRSTSIVATADVINDNDKQSRGTKTTLSINEISNISDKIISHDHVDQEFVNNFDMNYLPTFM